MWPLAWLVITSDNEWFVRSDSILISSRLIDPSSIGKVHNNLWIHPACVIISIMRLALQQTSWLQLARGLLFDVAFIDICHIEDAGIQVGRQDIQTVVEYPFRMVPSFASFTSFFFLRSLWTVLCSWPMSGDLGTTVFLRTEIILVTWYHSWVQRAEIASANVSLGACGRPELSHGSAKISVKCLGVHLISTISMSCVVRLDIGNEPTGFLMWKSGIYFISWYTQESPDQTLFGEDAVTMLALPW